MRIWLNQALLRAVREAMRHARPPADTRIQLDITAIDPDRAVEAIYKLLENWNREVLLVICRPGKQDRAALLSGAELESTIRSAVDSEDVITVVDPVTLGGCFFTFSPEDDNSLEICFHSWGSREESAQHLHQALGGTGVFYSAVVSPKL